jgi:SAM-dependent methyltransferase
LNLVRQVLAEELDYLEPDDPEAIRSRRDLVRINLLMGNARHIAAALPADMPARTRTVVDLGSGDGRLMLAIAKRLSIRAAVTLVDREPTVDEATYEGFQRLAWSVETVKADALEYLSALEGADLICANLFLHHFQEARLTEVLNLIGHKTNAFVACEPERSGFAMRCSRLLWAIGCNGVTQRDAVASVRAGFAESELSRLWPSEADFQLTEHPAGLFSHIFSAVRRG